jgi:cellulose synthase operon protein C
MNKIIQIIVLITALLITNTLPVPAENINRSAATRKLQAFLKHEDPGVRLDTTIAVSNLPDYLAIPLLKQAFIDDNVWVRVAAVINLYRIAGDNALPTLKAAIDDKDPRVKIAALWVLSHSKELPVLPAFKQGLQDVNVQVRLMAAWAIGNYGKPLGIPILVDALDDPDSLVKIEIANSFAKIADKSILPAFKGFLMILTPG